MVEIFETGVNCKQEAERLLKALSAEFPMYEMNFDLEDKDKILRVEGDTIEIQNIINVMDQLRQKCRVIN